MKSTPASSVSGRSISNAGGVLVNLGSKTHTPPLGKWLGSMEPKISTRALRPLVAGLRALGDNAEELMRASGIDPAVLDDPDHWLAHAGVLRLWQQAAQRMGDDDLGIHVALAAPLASFELHAYAVLASADLRDGLRRACRYQRLIHESTALTLDEQPGYAVLQHALHDGRSAPRHAAEFLAALWFRFGRSIAGNQWRASLLCFDHAEPPSRAEHDRTFACPIRFSSGRTALHIDDAVLDAPNPGAEPSMAAMLDRYAGLLLDHSPSVATTAGRLRSWMLDRLATGTPTAAQAARAMNVSQRTLHRRLRDEGASFAQVLETLRREHSIRLLTDARVSVGEVGFLMGFAELSSFHRAFKRWTGKSPAAFRRDADTVRPTR